MRKGMKRGTKRGRPRGPATCDQGQVRVGTRFALRYGRRTQYQQLVVGFGRASMFTGALMGEASRYARLLADSKTIPVWSSITGRH